METIFGNTVQTVTQTQLHKIDQEKLRATSLDLFAVCIYSQNRRPQIETLVEIWL
jgi:hypothetical protein